MSGRADRVGLAWREDMAVDIHTHLSHIDCLEVLADREFHSGRKRIGALRELARQLPLSLHGVGLGLACFEPVADSRLRLVAELVERVEPAHWSEHLAFVRAGGHEIGHLAAPPYAPRTVEGLAANLQRARATIGSLPHLENVATLVQPAGSIWNEAEFLSRAIQETGAPFLFDLHNWYANAWNFGMDPGASLDALPLDRIGSIHLSGGCIVHDERGHPWLIDDHIHDPPDIVFELLAHIAERCLQPLEVIVERDGEYPDFSVILSQLERARAALRLGRHRAQGLAA